MATVTIRVFYCHKGLDWSSFPDIFERSSANRDHMPVMNRDGIDFEVVVIETLREVTSPSLAKKEKKPRIPAPSRDWKPATFLTAVISTGECVDVTSVGPREAFFANVRLVPYHHYHKLPGLQTFRAAAKEVALNSKIKDKELINQKAKTVFIIIFFKYILFFIF